MVLGIVLHLKVHLLFASAYFMIVPKLSFSLLTRGYFVKSVAPKISFVSYLHEELRLSKLY